MNPSSVATPTTWVVSWPGPPTKIPTASNPQIPHTACTEIEPQGSSTFRENSKNSTEKTTSAPATNPVRIAVAGLNAAQPALLATRPAIHPLAMRDASGRRKRTRVAAAAVRAAAAAEKLVLIATRTDLSGGVAV